MAIAIPSIPRFARSMSRSMAMSSSLFASRQPLRVGATEVTPAESVAAIGLVALVIAMPAVGAVIGYKLAGGGLVGLAGGAAGAIALPVGSALILRSAYGG